MGGIILADTNNGAGVGYGRPHPQPLYGTFRQLAPFEGLCRQADAATPEEGAIEVTRPDYRGQVVRTSRAVLNNRDLLAHVPDPEEPK